MAENDFDFILNPQVPQKSVAMGLKGPQKLLMVVGLFAVVIVVVVILFSVLFPGQATNRDALVSVSATQTELQRVLDLGLDDVKDQKLNQRFQTLSTVLASDAAGIDSIISSRELKLTKLELVSQKDATVDSDLETALQKDEFDQVFEQAVTNAANDYFTALQAAINSAATNIERDILAASLENVQVIAE